MGLPAYFIKRPITISMIFLGITILGLISFSRLPVELMPNTSYPIVTITVEYPGVPPTEVESMVTTKVEEAVATVAHLKNIESSSEDGRSETLLEFDTGTDMNFAALEVREKFAKVRNKLPQGIRKPILGKYDVADSPIMILACLSDSVPTEEMRRFADLTLKEPLGRVSGVSNVEISGGRERKILVEPDQSRLQSFGVSIEQVVKVLHDNNVNLLAGNMEHGNYKYLVRTIGQFKSIDGIKSIGLLSADGAVVTIGDVATVTDSFLEPSGYARFDTEETVSIYVHKDRQANTIQVCEGVAATLEKLKPNLRKEIHLVTVLDQSSSIKKAIDTVKHSLFEGAILATLILVIALRSLRSPMIIGISIPLAMIATFVPMYFQHISLNTMTLSGLALACGSLVDGSIVVLDNVFKKSEQGIPMREACIIGSEEVGFAIVSSNITSVVVFVPIIFVNQEVRLLYSGLALTVIYSQLISMVVSQTLLPMLASRILQPLPQKSKQWTENAKHSLGHIFIGAYRRALALAIRYRYVFLGVIALMLGLAVFLNTKIGSEFVGSIEENKITVNLTLPSGTKLEISNGIVKRVEHFLAAEVPEIKSMSTLVEPNRSQIHIEFLPAIKRKRSINEILEKLRPKLWQFHPAYVYFEEKEQSGNKGIILDIFGYDYVLLKQLAVSIANKIESLPGFTDVRIRMKEGRPEMRYQVDKEHAMQFGLQVETLAEEVNTQMRGVIATHFHTEGEEVETIVRIQSKDRKTLDDIDKLTVTTPQGDQIYLSQIGSFSPGLGPSEIWRKNKTRMIQVSSSVGTDLGTSAIKVRTALSGLEFPKGYYYRFGGNYEKMIESSQQLTMAVLLTILLVYMVLAAFFESYYQPFLIMTSVALAMIGVMVALYVTGKPKSIGVYIGMLMLTGMVVGPAIILVDQINVLTGRGVNMFKAILMASKSRLRPIFMTISTTVLGLLPMALDQSEGSNLWSPLATTVLGGLVTSTVLTLMFIPSAYLIFEDMRKFLKKSLVWLKKMLRGRPLATAAETSGFKNS